MPQESIIDTTRPNAGRIYDYILGGHHNFEVDRQAAEQIQQMVPFLSKAMRLQRWCLQDLAIELAQKRGFDVIMDFASGLPTNDHIHHVIPEGTTVIYSDRDPVVVEYAHEILKGTPNAHFFQADARRPEELLNRPEVQEILKGRKDVALVYWGVSGFLSDEELSHAAHSLYEWAGQRSCWAFNAQGVDLDMSNPAMAQAAQIYERMGSRLYARSLERYKQLVQPWHADEKGFIALLEWHGLSQKEMAPEEQRAFGPSSGAYGVYLNQMRQTQYG